jgi:hypothetical protein
LCQDRLYNAFAEPDSRGLDPAMTTEWILCLSQSTRPQPIKYGELSGVLLSEDLTIPEEVIRAFEPSK